MSPQPLQVWKENCSEEMGDHSTLGMSTTRELVMEVELRRTVKVSRVRTAGEDHVVVRNLREKREQRRGLGPAVPFGDV